jgi:hypothetical protein
MNDINDMPMHFRLVAIFRPSQNGAMEAVWEVRTAVRPVPPMELQFTVEEITTTKPKKK